MTELELERTFLAKKIPEDLRKCESIELIDIYIPREAEHPTLRIRKKGEKREITKKEPTHKEDSSKQAEHTIHLTEKEYDALTKIKGKKLWKKRYKYPYNGRTAEIDVFQGPLKGLVLIDFEFNTEGEKKDFRMPEFCLADVTQEKFAAGGMLCGKKYSDIKKELEKYGYKKIK
ncbi:MAG: hypothetical protein AB1467_03470 [Candidatus Diapherotrites archaeon]